MRQKTVWLVIIFIILFALSLFIYRFFTDRQQYSPPTISSQISPDEDSSKLSTAPDFSFYDLDGNAVKLSDFFGQPIILHFWASWCAPCREELPLYQELYEKYGQKITFLMINLTDGYQETKADAQDFLSKSNIMFPVYFDLDLEGMNSYYVYSLPSTIFINQDNLIIHRENTALSAEKLQDLIQLFH